MQPSGIGSAEKSELRREIVIKPAFSLHTYTDPSSLLSPQDLVLGNKRDLPSVLDNQQLSEKL